MPRAGEAPSRLLPGYCALKVVASVPNQADINKLATVVLYTPFNNKRAIMGCLRSAIT